MVETSDGSENKQGDHVLYWKRSERETERYQSGVEEVNGETVSFSPKQL